MLLEARACLRVECRRCGVGDGVGPDEVVDSSLIDLDGRGEVSFEVDLLRWLFGEQIGDVSRVSMMDEGVQCWVLGTRGVPGPELVVHRAIYLLSSRLKVGY